MTIFEFLRDRLRGEPPIHPMDRRIAKRWVKERLKRLYPELRLDPRALEQAYQELGIEPHEGCGKGGSTVFEITLPGEAR
ncbi:MAG: hypothetical protein WC076_13190 [Terrimicrobiaceae bacterium]|jgi:hypothetical protein|nr:hypothetical protein [Terrimicrobiaceae bacterium]